MDAKTLIDDLLASAKRLSTQGRTLAEDKLGVPVDGERRDAMLDGMGKGALAAGALALLLGTGTGRRLTGSALKLGGLAAVGALAYKAYQNWQGGGSDDPGTPVGELDGSRIEARSRLLLDAMILAAMADGHIDDAERRRIIGQLEDLGLGDDIEALIRERLARPLDVAALAARADSAEAAAEIYVVSRQIIDRANTAEQRHLDALVAALQLDAELVAELERQLAAV